MDKEPGSNRLHRTIEELKQRLQKEREASETVTQHFTLQREQGRQVDESRARKLEEDLKEDSNLLGARLDRIEALLAAAPQR